MVDKHTETGNGGGEIQELIGELIALMRAQRSAPVASSAACDCELEICLLEKIARISCMNVNETHRLSRSLGAIQQSIESLLHLYEAVHPEQALQLQRLAQLREEMRKCCPDEDEAEPICRYEPCVTHGGIAVGDGYSAKSRGYVHPVRVGDQHEPWELPQGTLNDNEDLPRVQRGPLVGALVPSAVTARPLDFRSGGGPAPSGGQAPVTFRTFTESGVTTGVWPPDMSGAKSGDVVVMSGNLWLKLSVDGGKTFSDVAFNSVFAAAPTGYGAWSGDQVIHYVPQIDCFVLYVQSKEGAEGTANQSKSVVKVALASPADLKAFAGGTAAWRRQWNFTSDDFGLNAWLDFPDVTYGDSFLYLNTNSFTRTYPKPGQPKDDFAGKLFFELPLKELQAGSGFSFYFATTPDAGGSPTQNIGDENYWASHVNDVTLRIYSSKGSDANFYWRERRLAANWPMAKPEAKADDIIVSSAPDSSDWISTDHRIIGATRVAGQLWFAWSAANGQGSAGGFSFPKPHIQIAKFDLTQDFKFVEQTQVWNADVAFGYPCLTTNANFEVGISLAWGGGASFGSHAVGILGDFVVWFGEASDSTSTRTKPTRFGDYLHVRLAHPDTRFFSAFGYSVLKDTSTVPAGETDDYLYVEFGREAIPPSPLH